MAKRGLEEGGGSGREAIFVRVRPYQFRRIRAGKWVYFNPKRRLVQGSVVTGMMTAKMQSREA